MDKNNSAMKTVIAAGAASAFCGITLYAVGQVLSFLFRDVDPSRIEKKPENELRDISGVFVCGFGHCRIRPKPGQNQVGPSCKRVNGALFGYL